MSSRRAKLRVLVLGARIGWALLWDRWHRRRHDHHADRHAALARRADRIDMELDAIELEQGWGLTS
jgi:hypothetical protein